MENLVRKLDERAELGAQIGHSHSVIGEDQFGMLAGHRNICQHDVVVLAPPDAYRPAFGDRNDVQLRNRLRELTVRRHRQLWNHRVLQNHMSRVGPRNENRAIH